MQNKAQYEKVLKVLEDARRHGKIIAGGGPLKTPGYFVPLTIVRDIIDGTITVDEEAFGPLLPIIRDSNVDEVIARANVSPYGLGASVWSANRDKAAAVATRLESGTVWINRHCALDPAIPFPDHKQSGIGVESGREGLYAYTALQVVNVNKAPAMVDNGSFTEQLFRIQGKTAVVTGGAKGIGAMISSALVKGGVHVIVVYRSAAEDGAFAAELAAQGRCTFMAHDLATIAGVRAAAGAIAAAAPRLHILINNAGLFSAGRVEDTQEVQWDAELGLNLQAPFSLVKTLLPHWRRRPHLAILHGSSILDPSLRSGRKVATHTPTAPPKVGRISSHAFSPPT